MRKLLLSAILLVSGSSCFAVDVIVTKNAEKIDGKVTEVSSKEIRYKKASNPDGPVYVIETDKVSTVVYENGEVDVFPNAPSGQVSQEQTLKQTQVDQKKKDPEVFQAGKNMKVGKIYHSRIKMTDGKKVKCYHNEDNSIVLGDIELEELFKEKCDRAYKHLQKAFEYAKMPNGVGGIAALKMLHASIDIYNEECAE